jgi:hypothetical protein
MELGRVKTCNTEALTDVVYLLFQRGALDIRDMSRLTCVATFFRDFLKMFVSAADIFRCRMELLRDVGKGLVERLRELELRASSRKRSAREWLEAKLRDLRKVLIPDIEVAVAHHMIRLLEGTDGVERQSAEPPVEAPEQSFSTAERQYRPEEIEERRENLLLIFREYLADNE